MLQVFRPQTGVLGDASQHLWSNLFPIMECPGEARITFADELKMRSVAHSGILLPADAMERLENFAGF